MANVPIYEVSAKARKTPLSSKEKPADQADDCPTSDQPFTSGVSQQKILHINLLSVQQKHNFHAPIRRDRW